MATFTMSTTSSTPNATHSNKLGKTRLLEIHQLVTEFLCYQSHVQLPVYLDQHNWIMELSEEEKKEHEGKLKSERRLMSLIGKCLSMAAENNKEMRDNINPGAAIWVTGEGDTW